MKGPQCLKCNLETKPIKIKDGIFELKGWKCPKCTMEFVDPEDAQTVLEIKKKKRFEVKVGKLGKAEIIRIPKVLAKYMSIKKGDVVSFVPGALGEVRLKRERASK